jgi:chromosome segregation protein
MRLKSLELNGYKTFASQTLFEFAGAVTAIVGPNGSGKSNVTDALRWVLGEQTYSLMRAKKTEDMIYAGSQHRSRSGMASVTVVLDNQDGWLPIDYSEVAIARRAYRDGLNEYLLNKQRVRLRDISELLAKCGLAERTYTIIGQGLVDAALALKAEERRRLFEEAAGIGLYRTRREEALRRLDITQRNLDRVQDILTELEPRLKSLERQAQRAKEYERTKSDLRILLREWYGYHWLRVQTELADSQEMVRQKEKALEETRQTQAELTEQLNTSRDRTQSIRNNLAQWHRRLAELHYERESTSRNLAVVQERIRSLEEQRKRTKNALCTLEEEIEQHQGRWETAENDLKEIEAELLESRNQVDKSKKELREQQEKHKNNHNVIKSARKEHYALLERNSRLHGRLRDYQEIHKRLSIELSDCDEQIEKARLHYLNTKQGWIEGEERLKSAQNERIKVEKLWQAHQEQMEDLQSNRHLVVEEFGHQQIDVDMLTSKLEILDQAERELTGYASGARLLIKAARDQRLKGIRGTLNSLLEVPAEFETAIASVLGNFLDAIIIDNDTNLDQALILMEKEIARGALLSVDQMKSVEPKLKNSRNHIEKTLKKSEEFFGIAAEKVKSPGELQPIVNLLLGNVLIVRNRETALKTLAELEDGLEGLFNAGVVTMNGEFYIAHGAIVIGRETPSGILGRERMRRELESSLLTSRHQFDRLLAKVKNLEGKLTEQVLVGDKLRIKRLQLEKIENETKQTFEQLNVEVMHAEQQVSWLEKKRDNLNQEIICKQDEMTAISAELAQIQDEISVKEVSLKEEEGLFETSLIDGLIANMNKWEKRVAVADQAFFDASERVTERKELLIRAKNDKSGLQERLQSIIETISTLEEEEKGLTANELENSQLIDQQKGLIGPAEENLKNFEYEQDELQRAEGEARVTLNLAEHQNAQGKISLAKSQEAFDSLKRRIEDDFGLVEFEYSTGISGPKPLPLKGLVEQLPQIHEINPGLEENLKRQRSMLRRIGPVNPEAQIEYSEVRERYDFLTEQLADLGKAEVDIRQIVVELDKLMEKAFRETFESVAVEFRQIFTRLFGGGSARLVLTDPDDLTASGIDIEARLPGRREQGLSLLSGGERSLAAVALVFALLKVSPTPFCILDEVDAMLDESNVNRFSDLLKELSSTTQFIIITHNPNTLQVADVIYGVTMGKDSSSRIVSLKLDEYEGEHLV